MQLNPRYGVWDPIQMLAVPTAEDASVVFPVAAGNPTPPAP
ncbi:hypothetical protein [Pseudonocardia sp. ICBG601]|nr:hypothetical protein [Pseudonocardia sp. ICBG601]